MHCLWQRRQLMYHVNKIFKVTVDMILRDKPDVTEIIDIFTCEDIISSHVRISYRFYQFVTTRYTTDFYIINEEFCRSRRANILRDLQNSSYLTKAEFNNCFIIHLQYFQTLKGENKLYS